MNHTWLKLAEVHARQEAYKQERETEILKKQSSSSTSSGGRSGKKRKEEPA